MSYSESRSFVNILRLATCSKYMTKLKNIKLVTGSDETNQKKNSNNILIDYNKIPYPAKLLAVICC